MGKKKSINLANLSRPQLEALVEATFSKKQKGDEGERYGYTDPDTLESVGFTRGTKAETLSAGASAALPGSLDSSGINPEDYGDVGKAGQEYATGALDNLLAKKAKWRF